MEVKKGLFGVILAAVSVGLYYLFPVPKAPVPEPETVISEMVPYTPPVAVPDEPRPMEEEEGEPEPDPEATEVTPDLPVAKPRAQSTPKKKAAVAKPAKAPRCFLEELFGGL